MKKCSFIQQRPSKVASWMNEEVTWSFSIHKGHTKLPSKINEWRRIRSVSSTRGIHQAHIVNEWMMLCRVLYPQGHWQSSFWLLPSRTAFSRGRQERKLDDRARSRTSRQRQIGEFLLCVWFCKRVYRFAFFAIQPSKSPTLFLRLHFPPCGAVISISGLGFDWKWMHQFWRRRSMDDDWGMHHHLLSLPFFFFPACFLCRLVSLYRLLLVVGL